MKIHKKYGHHFPYSIAYCSMPLAFVIFIANISAPRWLHLWYTAIFNGATSFDNMATNDPFQPYFTHWSRVTHICVTRLQYNHHCWGIVNSNKLQCNLKRSSCVFIQENAFENVVCEMASILSRPQCVDDTVDYAVEIRIIDARVCAHAIVLSTNNANVDVRYD